MSDAPIPKTGNDYLRSVLGYWWMPALVAIERAVMGRWVQFTTLVLIAIVIGLLDYLWFIRKLERRMLLPTMGLISGAAIFVGSAVWLFHERSQPDTATRPSNPATVASPSSTKNSALTSSSARPEPVNFPVVKAPTVILTAEPGRLILYNKGERNFYLLGVKLDNEPGDFSSPPIVVPKEGFYYLLTNRLEPWAIQKIGHDGEGLFPFDMYFTDEDQKQKFTGKFRLLITVSHGVVTINTQMFGVIAEDWSALIPK